MSSPRGPHPGDPQLAADARRRTPLLGFLIAAQLAAEGPRVGTRARSGRRWSRRRWPSRTSRDQLKARIAALRGQIQAIEQASAGSQAAVRTLNSQLEEARIAAGLIPLTGTGIVLKLEDSDQPVPPGGNESDYLVGANDLRHVTDELWKAGAEAVAINDERITTSTAIIDIGGSVLVNAAYLAGPYQVSAIGPPGCSPTCRPRPGSGVRQHPARLVRDRDVLGGARLRRHPGLCRLGPPRRVAGRPSPSSSGGSGSPAAPGHGSAQP